jgi:hypothetical protein
VEIRTYMAGRRPNIAVQISPSSDAIESGYRDRAGRDFRYMQEITQLVKTFALGALHRRVAQKTGILQFVRVSQEALPDETPCDVPARHARTRQAPRLRAALHTAGRIDRRPLLIAMQFWSRIKRGLGADAFVAGSAVGRMRGLPGLRPSAGASLARALELSR